MTRIHFLSRPVHPRPLGLVIRLYLRRIKKKLIASNTFCISKEVVDDNEEERSTVKLQAILRQYSFLERD